jgi:hypothetical protein
MPIIYTYPSVVPKISDLVLLSTTNSDDENITANASIASIKDVIDVVDNLTAGSGISVSNPTGDITIGNTGILSLTAGNNVSLSGSNDNITISAQAIGVNSISDFNGNNSLTGAVKIGSTTNVNVTFNTGTNKIDLSVLADISAGTPFSDSVIPVISGSNQLIDSPMQVSGDDLIMKRYIRHLGDNGALFGFNTDSEFLIYTESNDQESLRITPTGTAIKTNATNRFTTTAAGATELYYAGSKKFETTTTGSTLTGGLSLSDGTNNITISIPTITTSYDLKMPASIGTASQVLKLPSTIGSTPYQLAWGDAGSGGGSYTAGDGLDLTGTTFSTDLKANGGLVIQSTELAVDLSASAITGTLSESDGGTGASLAATVNNTLIGNGDYFAESGDVETGMLLPVGATVRRPTANSTNVGLMRYNSQTANFELCKQTTSSSGEYSWYTIDVTIITE